MNAPRTTLLFDVWLLSRLTGGLLDEALADSGLSGDDFGLYSLLLGFGPATPKQIAHWTGMRQNTVSVALKRMDERGDLLRRRNPRDGRSTVVALNADGVRRHREAAALFLPVMQQVEERMADLPSARSVLAGVDSALRGAAELPPRPYPPPAEGKGWSLAMAGPPLRADQQQRVREYVEWLRHSDADAR